MAERDLKLTGERIKVLVLTGKPAKTVKLLFGQDFIIEWLISRVQQLLFAIISL